MPTYDYECNACGHEFEKFQSIMAGSIRKCPSCGKLKVRRLIGIGAGIIFKGSGFYQTDYRSDSYHKDAAKDKEKNKKSDTDTKGTKDKAPSKSDSTGKKDTAGKKKSSGNGGD